jgi:hypothetical protein
MPNWSDSMGQTFEFYTVDPGTWKDIKRLDVVRSCSINRELESETLGSATIDVTESLGECYIRVYLITNQNGVTEKHPLGTFIVQTPSESFDGKSQTISVDAYTPLLELKENSPPVGFYIKKGEDVMENAYKLADAIVKQIDTHYGEYKTEEGKDVISEDMIKSLNTIVENGFVLHKYILEKQLYTGDLELIAIMNELSQYAEKLQVNEQNAKKLDFQNALQIWNQCTIVIATMACRLLDRRDNVN